MSNCYVIVLFYWGGGILLSETGGLLCEILSPPRILD